MPDWVAYSLDDFLLFSPRTYWRMISLYNQAYWPLSVGLAISAITLVTLESTQKHRLQFAQALLFAAIWVFIGWQFFQIRYSTINWVAAYWAALFYVQATLILIIALRNLRTQTLTQRINSSTLSKPIIVYGVVIHPLWAFVWDRSLWTADLFGLGPDSIAIATVGLFLSLRQFAVRLIASSIPVAWITFTTATHLAFPDPHGWVLLIVGICLVGALIGRFR